MRRPALLEIVFLAAGLLLWLPASRDGAALGAASIVVQASAEPATVPAGGAALITVVARSSTGAALPGANVKVVAGGGAFGMAATEAVGTTDERGVFRAVWRTYDKSLYRRDMRYALSVEVATAGHAPGRAEVVIRVTVGAPKPPPPARAILVTASAQPPTVPAGGATTVTVVARSRAGAPVAGASVKVAAGGGTFGDRGAREARGVTDGRGAFRTVWRTFARNVYTADMGYMLDAEVTKAGHTPGRARTLVQVKVAAPPPPPPRVQPIVVAATAQPSTVPAGGATTVTVVARAANGAPIPGAAVTVGAGGGTFQATNAATATGTTDRAGVFRTVWRTLPRNVYRADLSYVLSAQVTKPGHTMGRGEVTVRVTVAGAAPPPPRVQPIVVAATAQPPTVPAGGATTITVVARAANGARVAGAAVRIGTGGGVFRTTNASTATGTTDGSGTLRFQWRTGPKNAYRASMSYGFNIHVTKPGHQPGKATTQVRVTVAPTPPAERPIVVAASTNPRQIAAGGAISVSVAARSASGAPLPGASVRLEADGGLFRHTNNRLATGVTDARGVFTTQWRTDRVSAYRTNRPHQFTATVSKPGHKAASARTSVLVTAVKRIQ